ncbi:MAG TPA: NAD(+) diphosphatase [Pseudolysinimonas sp.]|nr:NAD(+) diphosphatase [Pseudolysinimonas sp.]
MPRSFADRLPLAGTEIDRDHRSRSGGIDALLADPAARAVVLHNGRALLADVASLALVPVGSVEHQLAVYLGRTVTESTDVPAGTPVLAVLVNDEQAKTLAESQLSDAEDADARVAVWGDLRRLGHLLTTRDAGLFAQALGIINWHAAYGFSPGTGALTEVTNAGWTREQPDTGRQLFPRTDAAVIMAVTDADDRMLLGSSPRWEPNRFSVLAGFVEPGETLEQAVVREVWEEAGLRVTDPVYLGSQPWPFPASIMLGFHARIADGASTEPVPDGDEIVELRWFTRADLADAVATGEILLPGAVSIARTIIEEWFGEEIDDGARR